MKFDKRKREREHLRAHFQEFGEDDDADPREHFQKCMSGGSRKSTPRGKENRKARQLCRQVAETLDLVLSGDCRDEMLQSLSVVCVEPAPDSSRLLVTLQSDLPEGEFDRAAILQGLNEQAGRLRSEIAASIARKRVPTLAFHVVGRSGPEEKRR